MKRSIFVILVGIFIAVFTYCSFAFAKDKSLPLTASASSQHWYYSPEWAVDGDVSTFWVGEQYAPPWWIMFDAGTITQIDHIDIKWHQPEYTPLDYDIQVSNDAANWEDVFAAIQGIYDPNGEIRYIDRKARYIRLYIRVVTWEFPVVDEFAAYINITIPQLIRFQANLADAQGTPLNGTFTLTFRIYNIDIGGVPLWEELQQDVVVEDGVLDVELGSVTELGLPFDEQYWLGVEVEADGEMTPRFKLTTVPYSFKSGQ